MTKNNLKIVKAAKNQEIQVQLQEIDEQVESHITKVEEQLAEEMTDNVDKYLNYVTEEWMEENQVAVQQQLRTELAEDFIVGLKNIYLSRNELQCRLTGRAEFTLNK